MTDDLISRQAALDAIEKIDCSDGVGISSLKCEAVDDAVTAIKALPSADAVEVVRCKDCKYWQDNNDGYPHEECRWGHDETPNDDDYCSYGEIKDE